MPAELAELDLQSSTFKHRLFYMIDFQHEMIDLAQSTSEESDLLDFKREFSPERKAAFWAETIKDIVAFANTRGGILIFGVNDDGNCSDINCDALFKFDNAALADQVKKYTGSDFSNMSVVQIIRREIAFPAILVERISVPLVFTKVGTYEYEKDKQKTAFSIGTIYFRHGSKSEPCTRSDIEQCISRQVENLREEWLGNIRRVVEAPAGTTVVVTQSEVDSSEVRITNDPDAPAVRIPRLSDNYPHRQSDVIRKVNGRLSDDFAINAHDVQATKLYEGIDDTSKPEFASRPHTKSSPQYSDQFIELIMSKLHEDNNFFINCRKNWKTVNHPSSTPK